MSYFSNVFPLSSSCCFQAVSSVARVISVRMAQSGAGGFRASSLLPGNVTAPGNSCTSKPLPLTRVGTRLQEHNSLLRSFSTVLSHTGTALSSPFPVKWNIWNVSFWHFKFRVQFLVFSSKDITDKLSQILNISGGGSKHSPRTKINVQVAAQC